MTRAGQRIGLLAAALAALAPGGSVQVRACATCFGASDSPMAQGMNMGILSLLGVIGLVLLGVVAFFGYLAWRMHRAGGAPMPDELPVAGESTQASWR